MTLLYVLGAFAAGVALAVWLCVIDRNRLRKGYRTCHHCQGLGMLPTEKLLEVGGFRDGTAEYAAQLAKDVAAKLGPAPDPDEAHYDRRRAEHPPTTPERTESTPATDRD